MLVAFCFTLVSYLAYSSFLKMDAPCSSDASVNFQRTTRRCIPEDRSVCNHRWEDLKPYSLKLFSEYLLASLMEQGSQEIYAPGSTPGKHAIVGQCWIEAGRAQLIWGEHSIAMDRNSSTDENKTCNFLCASCDRIQLHSLTGFFFMCFILISQ
jgi:hypothetical protein